jgi:hypothetical protein
MVGLMHHPDLELGNQEAAEPAMWRSIGQRNRFRRKAIPEPVFRYCSKSAARVLLVKQMAVRNRHGLNRAVERTLPSLW